MAKSINRLLAELIDGEGNSTGGGVTTYDNLNDLPLTGTSAGDMAFVDSADRLYISNGEGWYSVSLVNTDPSITSVLDADSNSTPFTLTTDGTATVITITANDPEDVPLTYSYSVTSGSLTNGGGTTATVVQGTGDSANIFTITPTTTEAYAGEFTLTFTASDGINQGTSANVFSLEFVITNSKYTTFLIKADADESDAQVDASSNSHTITQNGNVTSTAFGPHHPKGYSTHFDGSGDYLSISTDSSFTLDGDFTVEFWVYVKASTIGGIIADGSSSFVGNATAFIFDHGTQLNKISLWARNINTSAAIAATDALSLDQWYHIAFVRNGSTITVYQDGTSVDTYTTSTTISLSASGLKIGSYWGGDFNGNLFDLRIVKGTAVYTSAFTPPTSKLGAITNTSLLTCHLPYIADGSTNSHTITVNGSTDIQILGGPKVPSGVYNHTEYSKSIYGGSVYFDGTGDFLEGPSVDLLGSGAFTVECWAYVSSTGSTYTDAFLAQYETNSKFIFGVKSNVVRVWMAGTEVRVGTTNIIGSWHHFALVRNASNSCQLYIDGVAEGSSFSNSTDFSTSLENFEIGTWDNGANSSIDGYIADLRVVKGTAVYTSAFTPPTAPLTAITNTSLLTCTNKHEIWDAASGSVLTLSGDTTASTTQAKYANTSSVALDGTGDYIDINEEDDIPVGTENFTIECWIYVNTHKDYNYIFSSNFANQLYLTSSGYIGMAANDADNSTTYIVNSVDNVSLSTATWYHIAYVRNGSSFKIYVDGTEYLSATSSSSIAGGSGTTIGAFYNNGSPNYHFNGYIQDFRITKGLARYTASFTPPTSSLKG